MDKLNKVVKLEVKKLPKLNVIGKEIRYSDEALNNGDNRLPAFWSKCIKEGIFTALEAQHEYVYIDAHVGVFLDWDLGDGDFSYVVGMLMKDGATVPDGYIVRELAETEVALLWVKCKNLIETRTVPFDSVAEAISKTGRGFSNMKWCIDLYDSSRSAWPDDDGYFILDCYIPLD